MAQLVAHHTGSVGVRGSSPLSSTHLTRRFAEEAASLEPLLADLTTVLTTIFLRTSSPHSNRCRFPGSVDAHRAYSPGGRARVLDSAPLAIRQWRFGFAGNPDQSFGDLVHGGCVGRSLWRSARRTHR